MFNETNNENYCQKDFLDNLENSEQLSNNVQEQDSVNVLENSQVQEDKSSVMENLTEEDSIGNILSARRIERNLSYDQVVETTKIRKKYLIALENDDHKVIPNLLAARGFLKIYANFLDLDIKELVAKFNKLHPEDAAIVNVPSNEINVLDKKYRKDLIPRALKSTNSSSYNYSIRVKRKKNVFILTTSIGAILLILAIIGTSNFYFKKTVGDVKKNPKTKSQVEVPVPKVTPEQLRNKESNLESVYVTAKAINQSWVRVVVDGRVVFSGNMDRGNSKTWTGAQYISIQASRPDRMELMVNGEFIGTMSRDAEMKEITYYLSALKEKQ